MYKEKNKKLMTLLAKKIKKLRKERNLTQETFAEKIDVSRDHIAKVETGRRNVTFDLLFSVCLSFNILPKDLFDFELE